MKIINQKQLGKYLFWFGPFLTVAGLTAGLLSETWSTIPLVLLITGIAIIGLWLVWQSYRSQWWQKRSTQAGTNALVATLAVLVILGLINFLGTRYRIRTDLTETQLFTLSPQSQQLVQNLKQPLKAVVFDGTQNPQDRELLESYRRKNSKFQFEYVDPQTKPGLAAKFGVKEPGKVYLEWEDKRKLVQTISINERLSEIELTNKIQQIISDRQPKIYFLQGHGEHSLTSGEGSISQSVQTLTDKNYISLPLSLATNTKVPDDADVVIFAGAKRGLLEAEAQALQDYLNGGGNALLLIDPGINPNLNTLLQGWGVSLDNRLAVDVSGASSELGPATPIITDYGQHPITKDFGNGISFYYLARPIEIKPVAGVQSTPLLKTRPYPGSWAESDLQSKKLEFNPDKDMKGPLTLGVALTRKLVPESPQSTPSLTRPTTSPIPSPTTQNQASPTPSPTSSLRTRGDTRPVTLPTQSPIPSPTNSPTASLTTRGYARPTTLPTASPTTQSQPSPTSRTGTIRANEQKSEKRTTESRLVVIGNSDFITDNIFQQQLNGDVFLNSVAWLTQQDQQSLSIRPKEPKNRRINLSTIQANLLALSTLFILPLIGLLAAAGIWWKRR